MTWPSPPRGPLPPLGHHANRAGRRRRKVVHRPGDLGRPRTRATEHAVRPEGHPACSSTARVTASGARRLSHRGGGDEVLELEVVVGPEVDTALEARAD